MSAEEDDTEILVAASCSNRDWNWRWYGNINCKSAIMCEEMQKPQPAGKIIYQLLCCEVDEAPRKSRAVIWIEGIEKWNQTTFQSIFIQHCFLGGTKLVLGLMNLKF